MLCVLKSSSSKTENSKEVKSEKKGRRKAKESCNLGWGEKLRQMLKEISAEFGEARGKESLSHDGLRRAKWVELTRLTG